jgi:hypothetical protein
MNEAQSDSGEIKPTDPDLHWTGWALDTLREVVAIDMQSKRSTATRQMATPLTPETPDFPLMQSRLSRSVRLSIAMTERIRADYLMRKEERTESGEQERRRQRRDPGGIRRRRPAALAAEARQQLSVAAVATCLRS